MLKKKKLKAQTILESALVLVSLVVLAYGGIKLFTNLNQNMFDRLKVYRESRMKAVNSIVQGIGRGMNPKGYLGFDTGSVGIFLPNVGSLAPEELSAGASAATRNRQVHKKETHNMEARIK